MEERFNVTGKVQGVFFRKTFTIALQERGLKGGATNCSKDKSIVHCTAIGSDQDREDLKRDLLSLKKINTLGAVVNLIKEVDHGISFHDHDLHTDKLKSKTIGPGIKSYL
jgi:acylphosphatase